MKLWTYTMNMLLRFRLQFLKSTNLDRKLTYDLYLYMAVQVKQIALNTVIGSQPINMEQKQ